MATKKRTAKKGGSKTCSRVKAHTRKGGVKVKSHARKKRKK